MQLMKIIHTSSHILPPTAEYEEFFSTNTKHETIDVFRPDIVDHDCVDSCLDKVTEKPDFTCAKPEIVAGNSESPGLNYIAKYVDEGGQFPQIL